MSKVYVVLKHKEKANKKEKMVMNQTTVTMSMKECEFEKGVMEKLERERITNFLKTEYISLDKNIYTVSLDMDLVNKFLDKHYPGRQKDTLSHIPSEKPTIRMTCMSCGYKERSKFARIKNCPECDGLLVDPYDRDIMDKVLEKAGYIRRTDKQEQSLLSITLQDESTAPKVIYKGEEIIGKQSIQFDWETSDAVSMGGLTYSIEHAETGKGYPATNRIERRVRGHA